MLLLFIRRESLFDRLRRRNGDAVRRTSGITLDSPQKVFEAYRELGRGQSICVDILRGEREQTFNYDLK